MKARMRLSKTAREKLKKETTLYEHTCYFIAAFGDTKLIDKAYLNVYNVSKDLDVMLSSSKTTSYSSSSLVDDVSSIIIKSRSKVENELTKICEKSNVIETKEAFQEFLVHFKQGDISKYKSKIDASRDALDDYFFSDCTKEKAPQLTKQQRDDIQTRNVYVAKLCKESNDYRATLRFMRLFLSTEQVTNDEQRRLLSSALDTIMHIHFDFRRYITSDKVLCDEDLSLLFSEYRSKVVNVLQGICDTVSNLTVQEAYTRYLDDFKAGLKLSPQDHLSRFQNEDGKITSCKPKMSVKKKKSKLLVREIGGSRICKTPSLVDPNMNDYFRMSRDNHRECCMNNDLEPSDWDYDPTLIMARVNEFPRLELGQLPSPSVSPSPSDDDI